MTTPSDTPTPPAEDPSAGGRPAPESAAGSSLATTPAPRAPRLPSLRVSAALAAGMLAIGVAVGAAIGPTPSTSFAGEPITQLLPSIVAIAGAGHANTSPTAVRQPTAAPPVAPQATPVAASAGAATTSATTKPAKSKTPSSSSVSPTSTHNPSKTPATTPTTGGGKQTTVPPVTHVWLITLSGATFTQALAQPAAAPYIDSQLVPAGALLSDWSALAGSAFAGEASLLGGEPPQTLDSIVQPPCPEGAASAQCAPETAGALSAADEFLKATVPPITSSLAYREHGLIVITFGAIGNATASSLPAGSATATLSSQPPAGALLVSPFSHAGTRPSTAYDPTSPKQSLSGLLH